MSNPERDNTDFGELLFEEFEVEDFFDDSLLFPDLSNQDRLELNRNGNIFESPASSPLSDAFDMHYPQMTIHSEQRRSRRDIYGSGFEHQKLQNMPHFGQPFKHLRFFIQLGSPKLSWLKTIGKMYNEHFHKEIALRQIPKFSRNHSRRHDLAYFFIDDQKSIILPWLKEIGKISPDF